MRSGYGTAGKTVEVALRSVSSCWRQKLRYHVVSNPIMQVVYAALWAIPVTWALVKWLRAEELAFEVTPK
ncbi:MAG: hypothetical protein ACI9PP_002174 [Halobacteriales archaeon]|jgi:hypothetical protein